MPEPRGIPEPLRERAQGWARLWEVPDPPERVTVEFSRRFRTSPGLCRPAGGRIRLSAHLENGHGELLEEVLCHEQAHVAVYRLHGRKPRPRWLHRCPVCQAQRIGFRSVPEWRGSACLGAGLSGDLVITRLPPVGEGKEKGGGSR